jgi:serralysin
MPQLSDVLQSINASYGAVSGVTLPTVTETMTVSQYIAVIDTLQAQAISLLDSAIAAAIDAGRFIDVSVQLSLLRNLHAALTPQLVGIGIRQFEQGQTMVQVAELAMATPEFRAMLADQTDQSFVSRIYQNVVGAVPGQPTIDLFVGMLAGHGGTMSRAELLVMAANTPQNAVNIDLVGLADSGIAWL